MEEHRLTDRLTNYWNVLPRDGAIPQFVQFNVSAIEDLWQQCMLLTVQPAANNAPPAVQFYTVGEKVKHLSPQANGQNHPFQGAAIVQRVQEVITSPALVYDMGQFFSERNKMVRYRSCLLPFGSNDNQVTHIVAGLSWREF